MIAALVATAAACTSQPDSVVGDFDWRRPVADLDEAMLASCAGRGSVHAVGGLSQGLLLRYTGDRWLAPQIPDAGVLWWCWGDDDELVAVGDDATVVRAHGEGYRRDDTPPSVAGVTLYGVWGDGDGALFAVGGTPNLADGRPVALHHDGEAWRVADTSALPDGLLFKVWGSGEPGAPVWAVGTRGLIARFDGERWSPVASPTDADLIAVGGSGVNDVFAVGGAGPGEILRYRGADWQPFATAPEALSAIWTAPGKPLYVGGDRGYVARYARRGDALESSATATLVAPDVCVHGLFGTGDSVLATAADLIGGGAAGFRGTIFSHRGAFAGEVVRQDLPDDGGVSDAGPPRDAGSHDAAPGAGLSCGSPPMCGPSLTCWYMQVSDESICTRECADAADCVVDLGAGACCERPGLQTLTTVCMPAGSAECEAPL